MLADHVLPGGPDDKSTLDRRRLLGAETRERVLAAAEKLFAKHGFDGAGMREITREAGANSAAVHYHFGTKHDLLIELLRTRARPIAEKRIERLAELRRRGPLDLAELLRAFLEPALFDNPRGKLNHSPYAELRARLALESEPTTQKILAEIFDASSNAYLQAFRECLPEISNEDLYFRFHFMLGTMFYTMLNTGRVIELSQGRSDTSDAEKVMSQIIPFLAAGFRSASPA